MKIILEESLQRHMKENNITDILVELGKCIACGGEYDSVVARFPENEEIDANRFDTIPTELGNIYLLKEGITYGETLRFVWKSYYWRDGLGVAGAQAVNGR